MSHVIRRVSRIRGAWKWLLSFLLQRLGDTLIKKRLPLLACIPHDLTGRGIVVAGLYDEDLLKSLFEDLFVDLLPRFSKGIALDIGANIGNHTCYFAGYFRQVIAFEPNPAAYRILQANLALNRLGNVILKKIGLSDQAANLTYVQTKGNLAGSGFFEGDELHTLYRLLLRVEVGDTEIGQLNLRDPVSLIKVDVEGHEFHVLKGLRGTISANQPIIMFEIHPFGGEGSGKAIFSYLRDLGYGCFYSVEPIRLRAYSGSFLRKVLAVVLHGDDVSLEKIENPEERLYTTVVATTTSTDLRGCDAGAH